MGRRRRDPRRHHLGGNPRPAARQPVICGRRLISAGRRGSDGALKWMKVLALGLFSGMGTGVDPLAASTSPEANELPTVTRAPAWSRFTTISTARRNRIHYDRYLAAGYPIT